MTSSIKPLVYIISAPSGSGKSTLTNELLKLEEIREAVAYMQTYRESSEPFDVGVNGVAPDDVGKAAEIIQAYQEAGATWWIDLEGEGESFEEYRARIRRGPPRFSR